ncbi:hypothetical protein [Ewingella americana]|uniref:hypothetical protein n=1 Tax=Ewingella americana TaxID=41202 RepID=UPI001639AFFB|nr:hypothetical protein [Ewingella americana]QMV54001.1 hypothetical protein GXP68_22240 [Ewingella americana]
MRHFISYSLMISSLLAISPTMAASKNAELRFDSACDFKALNLRVLEEDNVNPGSVLLEIKLQDKAVSRMAQVTRDHLHESLNFYINGTKVSIATVQTELAMQEIQIAVDKPTAKKIFPSLMATQCKARE